MKLQPLKHRYHRLLGMRIDVRSCREAVSDIMKWSEHQSSGKYVCLANVHMCMEGYDDHAFRGVVNNADLVLPDGIPLVWFLHLYGFDATTQVRGTDLLMMTCREAMKRATPIGLYGGTPSSLHDLQIELRKRFAGIKIACAISPPFRDLTETEDATYVKQINSSGTRILFVGIGCPKQEKWMAQHRERLSCVQLGVGAAFDFLSGRKRPSPLWLQKIGLEWAFRFAEEPRRLWKRYLKHNPRFLWFGLREWFDSALLGIRGF